jgi:hypothetical protein
MNDMFGFVAGKLHDACTSNIDSGFQTLNVLCLLGSWGAFETFVEDASKAALPRQRELLSIPFSKRPDEASSNYQVSQMTTASNGPSASS